MRTVIVHVAVVRQVLHPQRLVRVFKEPPGRRLGIDPSSLLLHLILRGVVIVVRRHLGVAGRWRGAVGRSRRLRFDLLGLDNFRQQLEEVVDERGQERRLRALPHRGVLCPLQ